MLGRESAGGCQGGVGMGFLILKYCVHGKIGRWDRKLVGGKHMGIHLSPQLLQWRHGVKGGNEKGGWGKIRTDVRRQGGIEKFAPVVVTFIGLATWIKFSCPELLKAFVKFPGGPVEPAECVSKIRGDFRPNLGSHRG